MEYKGGGIEALLLFEKRGENKHKVREKRFRALERSFEEESKTRGIENIFPIQLDIEGAEVYDKMLGSIQIGNYPTFTNLSTYDSKSNMLFLFRAYTLMKEAQTLGLYNKDKNYGSMNLFSAITNCSKTSVKNVLKELSIGGRKHAKIFHYHGKQPDTDPLIGGAVFYNLTSNADEYVSKFETRLAEIDSDFRLILNEYKKNIENIIHYLKEAKIMFKKPIDGDQKHSDEKGPVEHNYYHIRGEKNLEKVLAFHKTSYQKAISKL